MSRRGERRGGASAPSRNNPCASSRDSGAAKLRPQRPARRSACGDRTGGASGADGVEHARLARVLGTAGARQRPQHSVGGHLDEPGALQRIDRQPDDAAVAVAQESDGVGVRPLRDRGKRPGFVRRSGASEDQGKHGGDGDEREKDQEIRPRHVGEGIVGQRVHRSVPLGRGGALAAPPYIAKMTSVLTPPHRLQPLGPRGISMGTRRR